MDYKVIDNFLPEYIFPEVQETIVWNPEFPWYISPAVARQPGEDGDDGNWNWYASHTFYDMNRPSSPFWEIIDRYFLETFCQEDMCRSFIRAKANFYANKGDELIEHPQHIEEMDKLVCAMADAQDKLDIVNKVYPNKEFLAE